MIRFVSGLKSEVAGGLALLGAAVAALLIANLGGYDAYHHFWELRAGTGIFEKSLHHWVNDGLMALFFVLVGMEIKHELLHGSLKDRRQALLPVAAAMGGFALPALLFVAFNMGNPHHLNGWAVPTATDIAFAVALVTALGKRVPLALRAFLLALAVIDDLMAIIVIALFYTADLAWLNLLLGFAGVAVLVGLNRSGCRQVWPFVLVGLFTWAMVLQSGVHATLAGVALGLCLPMRPRGKRKSIAATVERALDDPVRWVVLPLFAFANMGVALQDIGMAQVLDPLVAGVALALFAGKQAGVMGVVWLMVKLKWARLPAAAGWRQMYGVALICGIGFTMSLFIGGLAFTDKLSQQEVALGVLLGSVASAVAGWMCLHGVPKARKADYEAQAELTGQRFD